jgi:hypothetical protein
MLLIPPLERASAIERLACYLVAMFVITFARKLTEHATAPDTIA